MLNKVLDAGADAAILDLEDSVAVEDKASARRAVSQLLAARAVDAEPLVSVRVNRGGRDYDDDDLAAAVAPGLDGLHLPKAESVEAVRHADERVGELERTAGLSVGAIAFYPIVESAAGAMAASDLVAASPRVVRLAFGAEDFLADIAAGGAVAGPATLHVRGHLVLASRAGGAGAPVDGVHAQLDDLTAVEHDARWAQSLGFFGKAVIHPRQLEPVHRAFTPSGEEVAAARELLADFAAQREGGRGAYLSDGRFVDAAVVARARATLALAGESPDELERGAEWAPEEGGG